MVVWLASPPEEIPLKRPCRVGLKEDMFDISKQKVYIFNIFAYVTNIRGKNVKKWDILCHTN